jgi:Protein of unknown function (DUF3467)
VEEDKELKSIEPDREVIIALPEGALTSTQKQSRFRTDRFVRTYANSIAVALSQWDVSLMFGEITGQQDEDGKPIIEETVQIVLTREVVKAMLAILMDQISKYEQQYGEIKIPVPPPKQEAKPLTPEVESQSESSGSLSSVKE